MIRYLFNNKRKEIWTLVNVNYVGAKRIFRSPSEINIIFPYTVLYMGFVHWFPEDLGWSRVLKIGTSIANMIIQLRYLVYVVLPGKFSRFCDILLPDSHCTMPALSTLSPCLRQISSYRWLVQYTLMDSSEVVGCNEIQFIFWAMYGSDYLNST